MISGFRETFRRGVTRIAGAPQLWFTAFVAIAIVGSFLYVANAYITIAKDAEERLIDIRLGSLHDAFVPMYQALRDRDDDLRDFMRRTAEGDATVVSFYFVTKDERNVWRIRLSAKPEDEGNQVTELDTLLYVAQLNPQFSYREEDLRGGERVFKVVRAVQGDDGQLEGMVVTEQTLSAADQRLEKNIIESLWILGAILVVLLLLFLRHARIVDYTDLYRRLKEIDQLKDDFIGMASHELRTPLTAIRGYASLLAERRPEAGEDKTLLEKIDTSAKELDQLIADILDVSKIESGGMSFTLVRHDPYVVLKEVIESLQSRASLKGLQLTLLGGPDVAILADPVRFKQVLVNLVGNAIKYTEQGSIKIETKIQGTHLVIRISDTGIGMSAEAQQHLFAKFYRASGEKVRAQTGTGLGLWITKQLVTKMNGTIAIESIEGVGTHVVLSFPIVK